MLMLLAGWTAYRGTKEHELSDSLFLCSKDGTNEQHGMMLFCFDVAGG